VRSETPAAHLARLKVTYQSRRIERDGKRLVAIERTTGRCITVASAGELEAALGVAQR
jgi:hypothetical protein